MRPLVLVVTLLSARIWAASLPAFSDYEVILLKKPFGDLGSYSKVATFDASQRDAEIQEAQEKKEIQNLARQISLVAIIRTPKGDIAVGLVDRAEKVAKSFYLRIGESDGGWTIKEADFAEETATIEKGGLSFTLKLGKGLVGEGNVPLPLSSEGISQITQTTPEEGRGGFRHGFGRQLSDGNAMPGTLPTGVSYRDELRKRRMAENRARAEEKERLREELKGIAENSSKEAAAKREREINLELISRGESPLSEIELTEEEDAELVRKGVLPGE